MSIRRHTSSVCCARRMLVLARARSVGKGGVLWRCRSCGTLAIREACLCEGVEVGAGAFRGALGHTCREIRRGACVVCTLVCHRGREAHRFAASAIVGGRKAFGDFGFRFEARAVNFEGGASFGGEDDFDGVPAGYVVRDFGEVGNLVERGGLEFEANLFARHAGFLVDRAVEFGEAHVGARHLGFENGFEFRHREFFIDGVM